MLRSVSATTISLRHRTHATRGFVHGCHNPVLGAAAADVAFEFAPDLCFRGRWFSPEEGCTLHDHSRRTVAALHGVAIDECLLKRVQPFSIRQTFDRGDLLPGYRTHGSETGPVCHTVNQDRACATLALTAAIFCACQVEFVPKHPQQGPLRIRVDAGAHAIHQEVHGFILDPEGRIGKCRR